jgi:hypothetical protein
MTDEAIVVEAPGPHCPADRVPHDLPSAALRLLENLIDSEKRCEGLQGRLQEARMHIGQLECQILELQEHTTCR